MEVVVEAEEVEADRDGRRINASKQNEGNEIRIRGNEHYEGS